MVLVSSSQLVEHAIPTFQMPNPADPQHPLTYAFLFWNADGKVNKSADNTISVPNHDFTITQWYVQTGGNGPAPYRVDTFAFSAAQDQFVSPTAIGSVVPAAAWTLGSTSVDTTNSDVQITALNTLGSESFDQWIIFWGTATVAGNVLSAKKKDYAAVMGAFAVKETHLPKHPVWELETILDALRRKLINPGDPGPDDVRRFVEQIREEAISEKIRVDDITEIFSRIGEMTQMELRQAVTDVKGRITRLQAVQKMIENAVKGGK
jgi:hypothetical protein